MKTPVNSGEDAASLRECFEKNKAWKLKHLKFKVTTRCNLKCTTCTYWKNKGQLDFDLRLMDETLSDAKRLGTKKITFSGGEPFLHPNIIDLVALVSKHNLGLNIITNGTLLDEKLSMKLVEALSPQKTNNISFSLNAWNSELDDFIRGAKGAFNKTVRGIKNINNLKSSSSKRILTTINTVVNNKNYGEIYKLVDLQKELNVDVLSLNLARPFVGGQLVSGFELNEKQYRDFFENVVPKIVRTAQEKGFIGQQIDTMLENLNIGFSNSRHCFMVYFHAYIYADGRVFPCVNALDLRNHEKLELGDLNKESLDEIWGGQEYRKLRRTLKEKQVQACQNCIYGALNSKIENQILSN